ncbi:hypothetical protein HPB50_005554 [Hyalomma asiaticum]|uniref:Uncharacterized protein n=1 Tax=Hyalomma asiaticum TaxID=266040 RepID=A0ACB7SRT6_HYAAI|nr:hypothetical protein HPB50_005554 [Hyalomma asiaticum]
MVKRKDRTARRQILQLKEEKSRTYSPPAKNPAIGPAEPSSQGDNDEGDGHDEAYKNEPASNNGGPRDAIDDQLEDFMKEIDAISSSAPEAEPRGDDHKDESPDQQSTTATPPGSLPASGTPEEVITEEPKSKGGATHTAASAEGEVPACPWVECMDVATGYTYFWHQLTNEVTWDCPPEYTAYWAQYGEPVDAEATAPGSAADTATSATPGTSGDAQVLPEPSTSAPAPSIAEPAPNSGVSSDVQAADASCMEGGRNELAESSVPSTSDASVAQSNAAVEAAEPSKRATIPVKKKRKQEAVIGAIIPITSYGASDSSSSEGSDYETYSVRRARQRMHPAKRAKVAAKKSRRESPPPVAYGPQLPDSVPSQREVPVYGPQLPDASDSMGVTKTIVYGPHLPDTSDLESHQPPVLIGPQLPEPHEITTEKSSTGTFIGPVLPDDFFEKREERCDTENPKVEEPCPRLEEPSSQCMELGEPVAESSVSSSEGVQAGEAVQESTNPSAAIEEDSVIPVKQLVDAVPALSGLVDYPGSPVPDSETDDEGEDTEDKGEAVPTSATKKEPAAVNYPVMTGGKLQFESTVNDVQSKVLSQDVSKDISDVHDSASATAGQLKTKQDKEAKKGSQHLVSYGDSDSSDDDAMDVDVAAAEPRPPSTAGSAAGEEDVEERHRGLGCSDSDAMDMQVADDKKPPSTKPFVGVSFVRSSELLVLSECASQGEKTAEEETEEAAEEQAPCSDTTTGTERLSSPQEQTTQDDSDVDDFDDVVRALDMALLESQKKKAQEDSTKHEGHLSAEKKELSSDTSEEEGEIKSSDSSSEQGMTPMPQESSSDSEDEPEVKVDVKLKKDYQSSKKEISPKPETKDTFKLDIEEAYKQLTDQLNPLRDVIACRNSYFELVVKTMTRMEDWRAGALDSGYFLQTLHDARAAAVELQQLVQASEQTQSDESCQEPLPPGWQRHWDSGHARYFYVQEETGHSQWQFPTATDAGSSALDSTSPLTETVVELDKATAALLLLQPAPPPPPETDEAPAEITAKQEDEVRGVPEEDKRVDEKVDEKVDKKMDGASLDAAEAAFYSSFALSAEPVINSSQAACGVKRPAVAETTPVDGASLDGVPLDAAPVDGPSAPPIVAAPKKKKTKVSAGLTLRKKNIPTLLQKWEKIKEEQKRGMSS